MAGRIIVAGHICLDITPIFQSDRAQPLSQVLIPGKLVQMKDVNINTGGAVANTGLALKLLGADVELMGKVGDDEFGRIVLDRLRAYGVEEGSMIVSPDSGTSYSVVIAPPGTDRIFLHNPGANNTFRARNLDFAKIARADFFHFGYPPIMRHMYEDGGGELAEIFRRVKGLGLTTSLDMAAVDPDSEAARADWEEILKNVLPYVDYFVPSAEELCHGRPGAVPGVAGPGGRRGCDRRPPLGGGYPPPGPEGPGHGRPKSAHQVRRPRPVLHRRHAGAL